MAKNKINELIEELSKKSGISELIINKNDNVYVEREGELLRLDIKFSDEDVDDFCQEIAKYNRKEFNELNPILDGNLPDGSRVNFIHRDYTKSTHAVTIRRYSKSIKTFDGSPNIFGINKQFSDFLKLMVRAKMNIMVAGGTGVGKTTFLNLMLQEIPPKERIITIEDTRELQFNLPNVVRLEARPPLHDLKGLTIRDLLKNTLRMRPDRIIVGEVRGGEVFDLLQAMNTGHEGSMASVHANSPGECLMRMENLYLLSGYDLPMKALRYQISSAINFIIQIRRDKNGNRVLHQLSEIAGLEGDRILMQDIATQKDGELKFTGMVPACIDKFVKAGMPRDFFVNT
ncbi:MAG TPA: ATPase, T2SS/T4P/T4SS family [Bacteriovoracaceae bacterium]|nr:ATPase, T2SS/T4P/T4SS family [Bacteriovoracaceae bacterium]